MQLRPCFLVIDTEHAGSISSRKLVLETAKYNVITAYSCREAMAVLERFPRVHGVVMNGSMQDVNLHRFWQALEALPSVKLIVVGDLSGPLPPRHPDAIVESFSPVKLLEALPPLFPKQAEDLDVRESELKRSET